jgi:hypothetical protein
LILDVLAIAFNRFRQRSFKLPHRGQPEYDGDRFLEAEEELLDEFVEIKQAIFLPQEVAPQYTAAVLANAAVAEFVRRGSSDEAAVREAAQWVSEVGWLTPLVYPRPPESLLHARFNREGELLKQYIFQTRNSLSFLRKPIRNTPSFRRRTG